jgi:GNAT superfamily N-acetyltransferase
MITYTNEILDSYSGQTNCEAGIYSDNDIMGYAQYVLFEGELTISDIFVRPDFRRMGYGSRLIKYIKKINPDYKYIPSMKNEDGSKFIHKNLSLEENSKAKFVFESINFNRDEINPLRKIGIGKSNEIWREKYNEKRILTATFYIEDHFKNKKRYFVSLSYMKDKNNNDSLWFSYERLIGGWKLSGKGFSLNSLNNKPALLFEGRKNESRYWIDDYHFNEDVITPLTSNNISKVKKFMKDLSIEWFGIDFETLITEWFETGSYRVKDIKYNVL